MFEDEKASDGRSVEGEERVAGGMVVSAGVVAKAVKCSGKYRIVGGGVSFDVGDFGFFGKISFNDSCLGGGEDVAADEVNEDEGDCISVEADLVPDS